MDIITLIVEIVFMVLVISLAFAIWMKVVDKAWSYLEKLLGKKITGWISIILTFGLIIAVIVDCIRP